MNRLLIYEYIKKLKKDDIINFCYRKNINITNNELDIIYYYIKKDYKRFFNNHEEIINEIKGKVSDNTFNELMKLYDKYKQFI